MWLTTLPHSCANCLEIWEPQPPEILWACIKSVKGLLYLFTLKFTRYSTACFIGRFFIIRYNKALILFFELLSSDFTTFYCVLDAQLFLQR